MAITTTMDANRTGCPLCRDDGIYLWCNDEIRVVDAGDPNYPGYTRVVWRAHVAEMTELAPQPRSRLMRAVWTVEQTLRDTLAPVKVNLAEFGNQVPHLHWHIIPRWRLDAHFPDAIWAPRAVRPATREAEWRQCRAELCARVPAYHAALRKTLEAVMGTR